MKKLMVLIAALALFAAACSTDTTIDVSGSDADTNTDTESQTPAPTDEAESDDSADAAESDSAEAPEPTVAPVEQATAVPATAQPEATEVPAGESSTAPVEPAVGSLEAIRAVTEADNWCEAAGAVEEGTGALDTLNFTDPVELEQGLTQSLAVITASKALVPNQIAADLDLSIGAFTTLLTELKEVNWRFIDLDLDIIDQFDGPLELATYNIEAYNFAVCGLGTDPGEPPVIAEDGTVEGSDDLPDFDGTIRDQAVLGLVEAGFSQAEADCILENLDFTNPEAMTDPSALLAVFSECGISLDRLAQLGGG